jgi:hypothetical protein
MPTHGSVAKQVRLDKEAHPERFCPARGCLWRVLDRDGQYIGPCGKHGDLRKENVR